MNENVAYSEVRRMKGCEGMIKDLDQIKHQRNGFVRVGLLIEYLDQLAELKELEMGTYETSDGATVRYVVVAKGWDHEGSYIQLLYVPRSYGKRYRFLLGEVDLNIDQYELFDCCVTDALPVTETLIEYIVEQSQKV
ncbi:MAG: hypothetical protein K2G70_01750 [Turicibacter sp.]|nr:hypothetical protein [Turicibacter sp.]